MIQKIGRFCNHPFRFALLLCMGFLPLIGISAYLYKESSELAALEKKCLALQDKAKLSLDQRVQKKKFLEKYTDYDPYFLNHKIESIIFSETDQNELIEILNHPAFGCSEAIKKRKDFLEKNNHLVFREEQIRTTPILKETEEVQTGKIYTDVSDIERLLAEIEGVKVGPYTPSAKSPQLIVTNFSLERKKQLGSGEFFEVEVHLLKREFLKKRKSERSDEK